MSRLPGTRSVRVLAVPAADVAVGDRLWSDATLRELRVVATTRELVRADGNLLAERELREDDPERPRPELVLAVVLTVVDDAGRVQRLGGFAPRARIQVVRYASAAKR